MLFISISVDGLQMSSNCSEFAGGYWDIAALTKTEYFSTFFPYALAWVYVCRAYYRLIFILEPKAFCLSFVEKKIFLISTKYTTKCAVIQDQNYFFNN